MGKIKSAICLTLFTLLIAALCFICTVSFSYGTNNVYTFNSILRLTAKDADLGAPYGSSGYLGGGYSATYYPEGVISQQEYEDNLAGYTDDEDGRKAKEEYEAKYVSYGSLYLEKETVCGGSDQTSPSEEFKAQFDNTLKILESRYANLKKDGVRLEVRDELTFGVFLPKDLLSNELYAFACNSYMGDVTVKYGSSADSADTILPARTNKTINDYLKKASSRTAADGTVYVVIEFTKEGREVIADKTSSGSNTLYFMIGDNSVIPLSVSEQIDQDTLYISGSYTAESASICTAALNTALKNTDGVLELTVGDMTVHEALYGSNALYMLYIAYGVCFVAMAVFFFVRYGRLAFAHLYTYLIFLFCMILCVWSIPFVYISTETFLALMLASLLMCVGNVLVFEKAREFYAQNKAITVCVKNAYKENLWTLVDIHVIFAAIAFITFGIGLTNLSAFAFVFGLGVAFSAIGTLGLTRFLWAIMMPFAKDKGRFCHFKRGKAKLEEGEDDD